MANRRATLSTLPEHRKVCAACGDTFTTKSIRALHCRPLCKYRTRISKTAWEELQELVRDINATYAQAHPSAEFGASAVAADGNVVMLREHACRPFSTDGAQDVENG